MAGISVTGVLAGCLGREEDNQAEAAEAVPEPVDLSGGKQDDMGGMIIGEHFGPNGQIFYAEHSPHGPDDPAWFHTLAASMFPYHFERERHGGRAVAIYVTDYSSVDYELETRNDDTFISTHTAPETFALASKVNYVAGSDVFGGMGKDLIPFSDSDDAELFIDEHGGRRVEFADIDREFLAKYD
ncbi:nitrous oxide reductase accessory protein NosL [Haladaptatus sp. NG-SE-30]